MSSEDLIRLRHMLDATLEALLFATVMTRGDLDDSRMAV
jgi:hypothetical protein